MEENAQNDIVPLAIDNKIDESENEEGILRPPKLKFKHGNDDNKTESSHLSPLPLPITLNDTSNRNSNPPYISSMSSSSLPHSQFTASHLRPIPPLTPMSSIASDGSVINIIHEDTHNLPPKVQSYDDYEMPPPPMPQDEDARNDSYNYNMDKQYDYASARKDIKHIVYNAPKPRNHVMPQADGRQPRFYCNTCKRSFSGKQHFEYHMRTHTGEKPFKCQTCGKAFRAKHSLKNHTRIHTGERPYQCKFCGKSFRQLGVMKNHIKNMHSH